MKLLLRADASPEIGAGHVMRCLALAQECLRSGGSAVLAAASLSDALADRLVAEGVEFERLAVSPSGEADAETLLRLGRDLEPDWVVVDGYWFDSAYQSTVRAAGRPLLVIDDFASGERYDADLVLDQNLGTDESLYEGKIGAARLLLGPRYVLLRREFLELAPRVAHPAEVRRLLILAGGLGRGALVETIERALELASAPIPQVRLQAGALLDARSPDPIEASGRFRPIRRSDAIAEQMLWAELAISLAGSTVWELCFLGCPTILLSLATNQVPAAEALDAAGVMTYLGDVRSVDATALAASIDRHLADLSRRDRMSRRGRDLVDGRGSARVIDALAAEI